jgi:hypothetical protein
VAANPYTEILGRVLIATNSIFRNYLNQPGQVVYDCNPDSRGIDVISAGRIFSSRYALRRLEYAVERDERQEPLLQMADLCAYRVNRERYLQIDHTSTPDPVIEDLALQYPLLYSEPDYDKSGRVADLENIRLTGIRYEVAYQAALGENGETPKKSRSEFVRTHFVSPEHFMERARKAVTRNKPGISILRAARP